MLFVFWTVIHDIEQDAKCSHHDVVVELEQLHHIGVHVVTASNIDIYEVKLKYNYD